MTAPELVALREAARGGVSGTLEEWPLLASAFRSLGWSLPGTLRAAASRALAQQALAVVDLEERARAERGAQAAPCGTVAVVAELRGLAADLGPADVDRLFERVAASKDPEALRSALVLLGAAALLADAAGGTL